MHSATTASAELISAAHLSSDLALRQMPQRQHIWVPEDDWTGVIDQQHRRRLQNRLNQRHYRMKMKGSGKPSPASRVDTQHATTAVTNTTTITTTTTTASDLAANAIFPLSFAADPEEKDMDCALAPPGALQFLRHFESVAYQSYLSGSPRLDHLLGLRRLNVHRAINENIRAIGMTPEWLLPDEAVSIFNMSFPGYRDDQFPSSLLPTHIQRQVPHHPWLDFFPFPRMRDLLILAGDTFDDNDLCHDLMAFWDTHNTGATLIVWGEPWNPRNWEATEEFIQKWNWLLAGSHELLASTNFWRVKRGDKAVSRRLSVTFRGT